MKPSNQEFKAIFDSAASRYDEISNPYAVSRRREFFVRLATGDTLEVGAGTGEISRALLKDGHRVVATDISPNMVSQMQKKGIEAVVSDAEKLPFANESFDTVIAAELIYYLDNPERFIAEAHRVLKPQGRLLLSSANNTTRIYDRLRAALRILGLKGMYFDDKIRQFMAARQICTLLEKGGFRVSEIKKIMPLPLAPLDFLNRLLEKTPFKHFGIFILVHAERE